MMKALMYLSTYLYLLLVHIPGGAGQPDDQPWLQIPAVGELCPGQDVCPEFLAGNHTDNSSQTDNPRGCCSECSCDPSCDSLDNCCFPEMNSIKDRSDQKCLYAELYPSTRRRTPFTKSYYMTTKLPKSGCVSSFRIPQANDGAASYCESDITPWGSLLPVWSPSERKIFKNRLYAACHGVSDVIDWQTVLLCKEVKDFSSDLEGCNIFFTHQGSPDEVSSEQCFTSLYSKCPRDFHIGRKYKYLTQEDIRRGCNSGVHSPYNDIYSAKNVFCFMCLYSPNEVTLSQCSYIDVSRSLFSDIQFVSVIDSGYLKRYSPDTKGTNKACRIHNDNIVQDTCRTLLCPTGQVFSKPGGKCVLASRNWRLGHFNFIIKLRIEDATDDLRYTTLHNEWVSILSRDITNKWKLVNAFIPFRKNASDIPSDTITLYSKHTFNQSMFEDPARDLYLEFAHKFERDDPHKFLSQIDDSTKKKWSLSVANITYTASAQLTSHSMLLHGIIGNRWRSYIFNFALAVSNNDTRLLNQSLILLKLPKMHFSPGTPDNKLISKMFFCRQVRLNDNEFIVFSNQKPLALFIFMTNKYVFDFEFKLQRNTDGTFSARICLEDSGLHVFSSNSSPLNLHMVTIVLIVTLMVLMLSESA